MSSAITTSATTLEGQAVEVLTALQNAEADDARNPDGLNNITGNFDTDTANFTGTFSLPGAFSLGTGGVPTFTASEYTVD